MIAINGINYKLEYTVRGLFAFEQITGRSFDNSKRVDVYVLFFSILLVNNRKEFNMTFDEFIDECDKDPCIFKYFSDWLIAQLKQQAILVGDKENGEEKKKQ